MEEILLNYGVLGAWTLYLIYEKKVLLSRVMQSLDTLSEAINDWSKK